MNFASDNAAGVAPEILAAISRANNGACARLWPRRLDQAGRAALCRDFRARGRGVPGADRHRGERAGARARLTPPWGAVLCHAEAHIATDECGAPEFFGGGIKLIGLPGEAGKIAPDTLEACLKQASGAGRITSALLRSRCRRRPRPARSIASTKSARSPTSRMRTGWQCMSTARASPTRSRA